MADSITFNEGRKEIANNGLPATVYFLLSTKDCNTHVVGDTLAGGVGEITGTGYARQSESEPTATLASPSAVVFAQKTWTTGVATDWPASVKSVVAVTVLRTTSRSPTSLFRSALARMTRSVSRSAVSGRTPPTPVPGPPT